MRNSHVLLEKTLVLIMFLQSSACGVINSDTERTSVKGRADHLLRVKMKIMKSYFLQIAMKIIPVK